MLHEDTCPFGQTRMQIPRVGEDMVTPRETPAVRSAIPRLPYHHAVMSVELMRVLGEARDLLEQARGDHMPDAVIDNLAQAVRALTEAERATRVMP